MVESGCSRTTAVLRELRPQVNIATLSWTFLSNVMAAGSQFRARILSQHKMAAMPESSGAAQQLEPVQYLRMLHFSNALLDWEELEIAQLVKLFLADDVLKENEQLPARLFPPQLTAQSQQIRQQLRLALLTELHELGQGLTTPKNGRQWLVVTLHDFGAFWMDLTRPPAVSAVGDSAAAYGFVPSVIPYRWLLSDRAFEAPVPRLFREVAGSGLAPRCMVLPCYTALAGDVFRGAFAAQFVHDAVSSDGRAPSLERCVRSAVTIAAEKASCFSPVRFYRQVRLPRKTAVLVVGSGVVGLITAHELLCAGYRVFVYSSETAPTADQIPHGREMELASATAACFWMPFFMGIRSEEVKQRICEWAIASYARWGDWSNTNTYHKIINAGTCTRLAMGADPVGKLIRDEWLTEQGREKLDRVHHFFEGEGHVQGSLRMRVYVIDCRLMMPLLMEHIGLLGGQFIRGSHLTLRGLQQWQQEHVGSFVANCTGLNGASFRPHRAADVGRMRGDLLYFRSYPDAWPAKCRKPQVLVDEEHTETLAYIVCFEDSFMLGAAHFPLTNSSSDIAISPRPSAASITTA